MAMIYQLVEKRRIFFLFSGTITALGVILMIYSTITTGKPIQLGIDFTGGTIFELQFTEPVGEQQIRDVLTEAGFQELVVQQLVPLRRSELEEGGTDFPDGSRWSVRTEEADADTITLTLDKLETDIAPLDREATSTAEVSGQVGGEVTRAAVVATIATTIVISIFIWFAFRKVPHPFRYGVCAILAMFHDLLVMLTAISIFGLTFDWQADALYLTALLTVLGFSVQDTIVVFDRIRENINKRQNETYEMIVNRSVLETIHRSLATQLNAIFVMVAILLFGGETIRHFIAVLLIGLVSGTYSSIFIAVPLLVSWELGEIPIVNRYLKEKRPANGTI
jgi:preprotein translocase SecF subunit